MTRTALAALALFVALVPGRALAAPDCPAALIRASSPAGIVASLQAQGCKAVLGRSDSTGNPKITAGAAGHLYTIFFYGCQNGADCTSLGFSITFADDGANSAALANAWNKDQRFSAMSFEENNRTLTLTYDVTTAGGLTQVDFADVVDGWQTILGQARGLFVALPPVKR